MATINVERYLQVMTADEQHELLAGQPVSREQVARWQAALRAKQKHLAAIFTLAYKKQEIWKRQEQMQK